jgi:hypothetical protein
VAATRLCDVAITAESAEEFLYAVENHYWFQIYLGASVVAKKAVVVWISNAISAWFYF